MKYNANFLFMNDDQCWIIDKPTSFDELILPKSTANDTTSI